MAQRKKMGVVPIPTDFIGVLPDERVEWYRRIFDDANEAQRLIFPEMQKSFALGGLQTSRSRIAGQEMYRAARKMCKMAGWDVTA